jgi:hypothetical protein
MTAPPHVARLLGPGRRLRVRRRGDERLPARVPAAHGAALVGARLAVGASVIYM